MNRTMVITLCVLLLGACSRESSRGLSRAMVAEAPVQTAAMDAAPARRSGDTLAYEHTVTVELSKELLPQRMQDVQSACTSNKDYACTVLDMNLQRSQTV